MGRPLLLFHFGPFLFGAHYVSRFSGPDDPINRQLLSRPSIVYRVGSGQAATCEYYEQEIMRKQSK